MRDSAIGLALAVKVAVDREPVSWEYGLRTQVLFLCRMALAGCVWVHLCGLGYVHFFILCSVVIFDPIENAPLDSPLAGGCIMVCESFQSRGFHTEGLLFIANVHGGHGCSRSVSSPDSAR